MNNKHDYAIVSYKLKNTVAVQEYPNGCTLDHDSGNNLIVLHDENEATVYNERSWIRYRVERPKNEV